jgi:hypothetical protein
MAAADRAKRIRIMESGKENFIAQEGTTQHYLAGATYAGFDGAGAELGQQETARTEPTAAAARTMNLANFIIMMDVDWGCILAC